MTLKKKSKVIESVNQCLLFCLWLSDILAVACEDRMLSVFSSCGRRLLPAIQLATPVSALHCSAHFVMVLTAGATLSVWSVLLSFKMLLIHDAFVFLFFFTLNCFQVFIRYAIV